MLGIALRTLRFRKGGFLGTFIAVLFGATLILACAGLMETGIRTAVPPQRMAGADLQVVAPHTFELAHNAPDEEHPKTESALLPEQVRLEASIVDKVRAVPGVRSAAPDYSFPVIVNGVPASAHGSSSSGSTVAAGQILVPGGGSGQVTVVYRGKSHEFSVVGSAPEPVFADADVAELAGRSQVDSVAVVAEPGTDLTALADRLAPLGQVLSGDERGLVEHPAAEAKGEGLIAMSGVIGGFAITVAIFVVASTLGLSVRQRARELALMRAIGTTPGQLRRMVLAESMLVALVATVLGCVPGQWVGGFLFDRLQEKGVVDSGVVFHSGWIPMIVAIGAGLLTALGAALIAARHAARTRPTEALAESSLQKRWLTLPRAILAFLALGGGIALVIVTITVMEGPAAAATAGPSVMLWALALALIAPGVTRFVLGAIRLPLRLVSGVPGELGLLNARARTVRLASAVVPIMLATGIATSNIYLNTTMSALNSEAYASTLRADAIVTSPVGLPVDLADRLRATPGVSAASSLVSTHMFIVSPYLSGQDDNGIPVQGVSGDIAETTAVRMTSGSLDSLSGTTAAVPESLGYHVGDQLGIRLGDGTPVTIRVVATFTGVQGFETVLLPASLVIPHTTLGLPHQILTRGDPAAVAAAVATVPGAMVGTRSDLTAAFDKGQDVGEWVNYLLVGLIMAYTVISVVNTLVMATANRRREFGLQRLTGSSRGQVLRMMAMEGTVVSIIGLVLGTLIAVLTLAPYTLIADSSLMPHGPLWIYLSIIGVMAVLAMAATVIPTWTATKTRPVDAAVLPE
ncbi:FtsX-like permease family protein [Actinokineospora inagensis]|uniref:FtsX-like permease family protein n=1 Tax=Actinokineospora inagensis TaxID=103730 RepID=UPI0004198D36|nr:FtsX-like permease family protein [Actinokineospora inagensis]